MVPNSCCVLFQLDVFKLLPQIKPKTYLFYEFHELNHPDHERQAKKLFSNLKQIESLVSQYKQSMDISDLSNFKVLVLVEVPIKLNSNNSNSTNQNLNIEITKDICDQDQFKNSNIIKIKNINPRLASTAANCLLSPKIDPNNIPPEYRFASEKSSIVAKNLKLKDLFQEINYLKERFGKFETTYSNTDKQFHSNLVAQFAILLKRSSESEKNLRELLSNYLLEAKLIQFKEETKNLETVDNISILEFSKKLYELDKNNLADTNNRRESLVSQIMLTVNPLVELNILENIIEHKDAAKIVTITGFIHAHSIYNCLMSLGANLTKRYQQKLSPAEASLTLEEYMESHKPLYALSDKELDSILTPPDQACNLI